VTPRARILSASLVLGAIALFPGWAGAQSATGGAVAAVVNTPTAGSQKFAAATVPAAGGMDNAQSDAVAVANTLDATGLNSVAAGQVDGSTVSVTATAEAAQVRLLNGLISAKAVLALATSYVNSDRAASESDGSTILGLVIAGVSYGDGDPPANTRIDLPGVGYVVLNEQLPGGDGIRATGLTVNIIHVYLLDQLTGAAAGEIIVGTATSTASL
jgi:hypothetical protein